MKRLLLLTAYFIFLTGIVSATEGSPVGAAEGSVAEGGAAGGDWTVINSSYATIYVQNSVDLKSTVRKIDVDFARYDPVEKKLFLDRTISDTNELANKIDILARKARKILDMYPPGFKINIKIYDNQEALNDIYKEIFEEEADHKAFYVHKFHTIYISFSNLSESVLAHEIGHAIIDAYFTISPPPKIKELLACYVDLHLRD